MFIFIFINFRSNPMEKSCCVAVMKWVECERGSSSHSELRILKHFPLSADTVVVVECEARARERRGALSTQMRKGKAKSQCIFHVFLISRSIFLYVSHSLLCSVLFSFFFFRVVDIILLCYKMPHHLYWCSELFGPSLTHARWTPLAPNEWVSGISILTIPNSTRISHSWEALVQAKIDRFLYFSFFVFKLFIHLCIFLLVCLISLLSVRSLGIYLHFSLLFSNTVFAAFEKQWDVRYDDLWCQKVPVCLNKQQQHAQEFQSERKLNFVVFQSVTKLRFHC